MFIYLTSNTSFQTLAILWILPLRTENGNLLEQCPEKDIKLKLWHLLIRGKTYSVPVHETKVSLNYHFIAEVPTFLEVLIINTP